MNKILHTNKNYLMNIYRYEGFMFMFYPMCFYCSKSSIQNDFKRRNHRSSNVHTPVKLNYKFIKGNSDLSPVVICHGMLGSHQNWSMIGKKINQETERSVYIPDMRNHGNSPHSSKMTYYDMAADIEHFIKNHELGKVVALGKLSKTISQ